jgi:Lysozyme like domain
MAARIDGVAVGTMAAGSVLLYAGITGRSVPAALQAIIRGKSPSTVAKSPASSPGGAVEQIVQDSQPGTPGGPPPVSPAPSSTTPAVSGGTYSHAQLMTLWVDNGGSSSSASNAACHGIQESSGRSWVTSSNPDGGTNVGLWQLDTKGVGSGHSIAELQDPDTNARITIAGTRNGADWSEWATPGC